MTKINLKDIVEKLIDTFLYAGKVSLELREKGLWQREHSHCDIVAVFTQSGAECQTFGDKHAQPFAYPFQNSTYGVIEMKVLIKSCNVEHF